MNRLDRFQSFGYSEQLPTAYGTGALEPPDDLDDLEPYYPLDDPSHREGERVNYVTRCVSCGDIWPCEASEPEGN